MAASTGTTSADLAPGALECRGQHQGEVTGHHVLPAAELAAALGNQPGDEVGVLDVAGVRAARVRRREQVGGVAVGDTDVPWPEELPVTRLDVYVPVPGRPEMLLLSFSTPIDPIADAMVALFDAIAGSLRWQHT